MATLAADTFTDTDGTALTAHTSDSAHSWSLVTLDNFTAGGNGTPQITSDQLANAHGSLWVTAQISEASGANLQISLDAAASANMYGAIFFRKSDGSNFWAAILNPSSLVLQKVVAGSATIVDSISFGSLTGGTLIVTANGNSISASINSHTVSTSDSFNNSAVNYGLILQPNGGSRTLDNFQSETVSAPSGGGAGVVFAQQRI